MLEHVTFLLAVLGYAGLTVTAVVSVAGRFPRRLWWTTALTIVVHVALVWAVRYEWRLGEATRNGYVGFVLFHTALALVVVSLAVREQTARGLVWVAFAIVTPGAIGAVFLYEAVMNYRAVVIAIAAVGLFGLGRARWLTRQRPITAD